MSGVKDAIVNIRESERNRIMNAVQQTERFSSELHTRIEQANNRLQGEFRRNVNEITQRQNRFEQNLAGLKSDLKDLEKRQNHRIAELNRFVEQEFQRTQTQLHNQRTEYIHLIKEQNRVFTQAMEKQRVELQSQLNEITDHIRNKEQNEQKAAAVLLADVRTVLDNIEQNTAHAKFKPGVLEQICLEFSLAESNHRNGFHQAAISTAQSSYLKAQDLRLELIQLEYEWNIYLAQARTSAAEVLAMCDTQQTAKLTVATEEGSEEIAAEIDFWTEGRLTDLRQKVLAESSLLSTDSSKLTLDDLKTSIERSTTWMKESQDIAEAAREALIKSQVRQNIAQSIANSFEGTGWQVMDSVYTGEDHRGALHTKFMNPTGDEIVTIVRPEKSSSGEILNRLEVNFFDESNDERFRHARLQDIFQYMREEGIDAGRPQTRKGYETGPGDQSVRNFERVRQQMPVPEKNPKPSKG